MSGINGTDPLRPDGPPRPASWNLRGAWNIPDVAPDETADPARPLAALVSFHYLRAAVRRRRLRFLLTAMSGLLLAGAFLAMSPALPTATTTLMLTHDANADPSGAMATDVSLLSTRTVAERTIKALGLDTTPNELLSSITPVETGSPEILQLSMTGPTRDEAVRRLNAFSTAYLNFRSAQVGVRSRVLIAGYAKRIDELQAQRTKVDGQLQSVSPDKATDLITERSKLSDQVLQLEAERQQAQLQENAIVNASRVVDPAAPTSSGGTRRVLLVLASGLIGGLALGFAAVVLQAILSDRLWLRTEVASALDTRVPLSVRRIAPIPLIARAFRFLPAVKTREARRSADRQRMARAIEQSLPEAGWRQSLAVLCLGNSDEMRYGVVAAAQTLRDQGRTATVVDLTETGCVAAAAARLAGSDADRRPEVFRPTVVPSLARGPADLDSSNWDDVALAKVRNGTTLVVADLDTAVGVDHLTAWTDDVLVSLSAGRSGVELVRTTGDLVRSTGLRLTGAVLLRAVRDDDSSGRLESPQRAAGVPRAELPRSDVGAGRSRMP
jgi:capsular polysaccharide biosynthesis protein